MVLAGCDSGGAAPGPSGSAGAGSIVPGSAPPAGSGTATGLASPLQARPLVVAVAAGGKAGPSWSGLHFSVPTSHLQFAKLTGAERSRLRGALASSDCASPAVGAGYRVACTRGGYVLLAGPVLVSGADVVEANAVAPSAAGTDWTLQVRLSSAASRRLAAYTSAHNTGGSDSASFAECGPGSVPCADYLAVIVAGTAVSVPVMLDPVLGGSVQFSGGFDEATADALARQLSG